MKSKQRPVTPAYLWFDSEFTSLDLGEARLLQVALLITDNNLRRLTPSERDVNLHIVLDPGTRCPASPTTTVRGTAAADAIPPFAPWRRNCCVDMPV